MDRRLIGIWGIEVATLVLPGGGRALDASQDFSRGDATADGRLGISDAIATLQFLFLGIFGPPCLDAIDADDSGRIDIVDAVYTLTHLFLGGRAPPHPAAGTCGGDPTQDDLDCRQFPPCPQQSPEQGISRVEVLIELPTPTGVPGQRFQLIARTVNPDATLRGWVWDLGDGRSAEGARVQVAYERPGIYGIKVHAISAGGEAVEDGTVITVFGPPDAPRELPAGIRFPSVMGDVDGDGRLTGSDVEALQGFVLGTGTLLSKEAEAAADLDLDGEIQQLDVELARAAVAQGQPLPSVVHPTKGAPGRRVNIISAMLLDSRRVAKIQVGNLEPADLFRPLLGYGTFLVPIDTAHPDLSPLPPGPTEVRLLLDGEIVETHAFDVSPVPIQTGRPGDTLRSVLGSTAVLRSELARTAQRILVAAGADDEEQAVIAGILHYAESELLLMESETAAALARLPPEAQALLDTVARANGLDEAAIAIDTLMGQLQGRGRGGALQGDEIIAELCRLKQLDKVTSAVDDIVTTACDVALIAAVGAALATQPELAVAFVALVTKCAATAVPTTAIETVVKFASSFAQGRLIMDYQVSPEDPDVLEIRPRVQLFALEEFCKSGPKAIVELLSQAIVKKAIRKVAVFQMVDRILGTLSEDFRKKVREAIQDGIAAAAHAFLSAFGIDQALERLAVKICNEFNPDLALRSSFPVEPLGVLRGPFPPLGRLELPPPGTGEPARYRCDDPRIPAEGASVTIEGRLDFCGRLLLHRFRVRCEGSENSGPPCPAGEYRNPESNECSPVPCAFDKVRDPVTGDCVEPRCPPGTVHDAESDECRPFIRCGFPYTFNPLTEECEPATCPPGQVRNPISNLCVPAKCPAGTERDLFTFECVAPRCPPGATLDSALGKCVCPNGNPPDAATGKCLCEDGRPIDPETLKCEECPVISQRTGECLCDSLPQGCPEGSFADLLDESGELRCTTCAETEIATCDILRAIVRISAEIQAVEERIAECEECDSESDCGPLLCDSAPLELTELLEQLRSLNVHSGTAILMGKCGGCTTFVDDRLLAQLLQRCSMGQ